MVDVQPYAPNELSEYCTDACHSHTPSDDFDNTDIMHLYDIASVVSAVHKWYTNQVAMFIKKKESSPTADCMRKNGLWRTTRNLPHPRRSSVMAVYDEETTCNSMTYIFAR